jgi:hypothetical protein
MKSYLALLTVACLATVSLSQAADINFGPQQFVQAGGVDIQVPGYSVPSLADWNNDGRRDLIVGEGGGTALGKVRVYLNVGTDAQPVFRDYFYAQSIGGDLTCTPIGCMGCFPRVVDWDEDGKIDLLVGQADGTVRIFMNYGDANFPTLDAGAKIITANGSVNDMDVGDRATPSVVDWNSDGMLDIVSGGLDGIIHIFLNCGCGGSVPPRFLTSPPAGQILAEGTHDLIVPGLRSCPAIVDLDGDGKKDIVTGNTDGQVLFYKNVGLDSLPMFSGYSLMTSAGTPIDLPDALRTRPFVCRWGGDGKLGPHDGHWDMLVGYGDGKVRLFRNTTTVAKAGDLDGDGDIDGDDFTILAKALDKPISHDGSAADLNLDGVVDAQDLRVFATLWLTEHK